MKKYILTIGNSGLNVISSTVIVLPFMFFLRISGTHTALMLDLRTDFLLPCKLIE